MLVKAVAQAFRWRRMMETDRYGIINELPAAEEINSSYVSRLLRLTLLAPDIVEAILDGRQANGMTRPALTEPFLWSGVAERHAPRRTVAFGTVAGARPSGYVGAAAGPAPRL
jgi:hypothetical protein